MYTSGTTGHPKGALVYRGLVDFVHELNQAVQGSDVLLAVIGRRWLNAATPSGTRRLDDTEDFVRVEVQTALSQGIRVIPVLVDGAQMPAAEELPEPLRPLARRHAVEISHSRFASDADRLVRAFGLDVTPAAESAPVAEAEQKQSASAARPVPPAIDGAGTELTQTRVAGAALTVWAIVASGAFGNLAAEPGPAYWLERAGRGYFLWAGFNVMIGPALALKIWLPRFSVGQFWGVVGATFAALATLIGSQQLFTQFLLPDVPAGRGRHFQQSRLFVHCWSRRRLGHRTRGNSPRQMRSSVPGQRCPRA